VDVIVDFASIATTFNARRLWLENRALQTDPEKPLLDLANPGTVANALVEFRLGNAAPDASADPATITSFAPIALPPVPTPALTRTFNWDSIAGGWAVNGRVVDCSTVRFWMKRGRPEKWVFDLGGGWAHPLHLHFVEGRVVLRNRTAVAPTRPDFGRVDVVALYPGESAEFVVTPTDYVGVYPYHCHNAVHEDYGMMLLLGVDDVGDTNTQP
jgi:FtsP/CotA-like multicopper oxidase with cupredoxin domain